MSSSKSPVIQQGWLRAVVFLLVYIILIIFSGFFLGIFIAANKPDNSGGDFVTQDFPSEIISVGIIITFLVSLVTVYIFRKFLDRKSISSLGLKLPIYKYDPATGFLLGPFLLGIGATILYLNHNLEWVDFSIDYRELLVTLGLMLMVAIGEELAFRGYLLCNLMESLNKFAALGISAAVFALVHGTNPSISGLAILNLFLGGCLLGINYIYTKNLWFAILFHFTWNFFQGPVYGFKVSGLQLQSILKQELHGNPIFTGGPFGFEGSLVATILCCSCLCWLFLAYEKKYSPLIK